MNLTFTMTVSYVNSKWARNENEVCKAKKALGLQTNQEMVGI